MVLLWFEIQARGTRLVLTSPLLDGFLAKVKIIEFEIMILSKSVSECSIDVIDPLTISLAKLQI